MKKQILRFSSRIFGCLFVFRSFANAQTRTDVYAITNAQIVTVSGKTIDRGTVVVRNGLIESVGAAAKIPADAQVIDGGGLTIYPGFFDTLTKLGLPAQTAPARRSNSARTTGTSPQNEFKLPRRITTRTNCRGRIKSGRSAV